MSAEKCCFKVANNNLVTSSSALIPGSWTLNFVVIFNWLSFPKTFTSALPSKTLANSAFTVSVSIGFSKRTWNVLPPTKSTPSSRPFVANEITLIITTILENR